LIDTILNNPWIDFCHPTFEGPRIWFRKKK